MPAQQRHHRLPVLAQRQDRRLGPLVRQQRRHRPDQDPGGTDPDHRHPGGEQIAQMRRRLGELGIGAADPAGPAVQRQPQRRRDAPSRHRAGLGQADHNRAHSHGSASFGTRIIEK